MPNNHVWKEGMSELEWTESHLWVSIVQEEFQTDSLTSALLW